MLNTSAGLYTTLPHALQQYIANKLKLNTALQVEFPPSSSSSSSKIESGDENKQVTMFPEITTISYAQKLKTM